MPRLQGEFLEWLFEDQTTRHPRNEALWAKSQGLAPGTLKKWKQDRRFREMWDRRAQEELVAPERIQDILDVLYEAATVDKDLGAVKQYLAEAQKLAPPKAVRRDAAVAQMTDAELAAELQGLLAEGL